MFNLLCGIGIAAVAILAMIAVLLVLESKETKRALFFALAIFFLLAALFFVWCLLFVQPIAIQSFVLMFVCFISAIISLGIASSSSGRG